MTLVVAVTGIVASLPLGILLALGRRSELPVVQALSVAFIEFWRGVPLITVLFMAAYMLPLFLPGGLSVDKLLSALIAVALFSSAYMAEVVRGGLQAIPKGQYEAAQRDGARLLAVDGVRHLAAGAAPCRCPTSSATSSGLLEGHVAGFDHRVLRSARHRPGGYGECRLGDAEHGLYGLCVRGRVVLGYVFLACRAMPSTWKACWRRGSGGERQRSRNRRPQQVVQGVPRAEGHQPHRRARRAVGDLRAVGLGQVDADPLHQRA